MKTRAVAMFLGVVGAACSGKGTVQTATKSAASTTGNEVVTVPPGPGFGGRLFDNWSKELKVTFVADNPTTPEADGQGGPFNNGTLPDSEGKPMLNTGHDYRLKNLFGWDLRGGDGIYGARFEKKTHVLLPDFLKNTDSREVWIARLEHGEDAIPAYGKVLSHAQIEAVVDFLLGVRDGALPQPADLFTLVEGVTGFYELNMGGDAERGHAYVASTCAKCHGADGTRVVLDDGHSLGTFMRSEAYESWLKIINGDPGSPMHSQLPEGASRDDAAELIRDLNAALCDRTRYPKGTTTTAADVPDGDKRCGSYLK